MEKIKITKLKDSKDGYRYNIDCQLSIKELFDKLQIDRNDGSNDIIATLSEKIKKRLPKDSNNLTDTWKIANTKELINLKFLLELRRD